MSKRDQATAGGNFSMGSTVRAGGEGGALTSAQKRSLLNNASVATRALADKGEALDKARTGSEFQTVEGQYRAMDGENLLKSMFNNPHLMTFSAQAWTQTKMQSEGLGRRFKDLELNPGEASRQEVAANVRNTLAYMSANGITVESLKKYEIEDLQENLRRLDLFHGDTDGYAASPGLAGAIGGFVASDKGTEELLKRGAKVIEDNAPKLSKTQLDFGPAANGELKLDMPKPGSPVMVNRPVFALAM